jgi:hypothetical protein
MLTLQSAGVNFVSALNDSSKMSRSRVRAQFGALQHREMIGNAFHLRSVDDRRYPNFCTGAKQSGA